MKQAGCYRLAIKNESYYIVVTTDKIHSQLSSKMETLAGWKVQPRITSFLKCMYICLKYAPYVLAWGF